MKWEFFSKNPRISFPVNMSPKVDHDIVDLDWISGGGILDRGNSKCKSPCPFGVKI